MEAFASSPEQQCSTVEGTAIEAVGILASNSIGYVREMFNAYAKSQVVIPLKNREFAERLTGIAFSGIVDPAPGTGWFTEKQTFRTDDALAQISFTSGTEGQPKRIALTYKALADVIERLNSIMQIDSSIREYVGVPVYYSFGFGRFRACSSVGGKAYIPPNGFDPFEIAAMLEKDEINAISAVPSLWRILLANPEVIGSLGKKVRWIEIGSQYMSRQEKEAMKTLFPNARIVQHYGLTEASRTTLLDISATEGPLLESVGKTYGSTEIRLTGDGIIQIKGPHIAIGTITDTGILPLADTDGWLTTTDLGAIENGHLFFKGRADDAINCGGIKLFPEQLETPLLKTLGQKTGIAVTRVPDVLRGDGILIAVTKESGLAPEAVKTAASNILTKLNINAGDALHVIEIDTLPKTETGKIQRKILAEQFTPPTLPRSETGKTAHEEKQNLSEEQQRIVAIWEEVLGIQPVSIHTSFFDLGGDSLSSLKMMLKLEKAGIPRKTAQAFFEGKTIAEITGGENKTKQQTGTTASAEQQQIARTSDAINATRGLMVLWLVAIHWLPGVWKRLPEIFAGMDTILNPAYRLGTPGFALVFGLNVGFFFFHQLEHNPSLAVKNLRFASRLVAGGILLLAAINYLLLATGQHVLSVPLPTNLFYSVLLYYFLAILSIRFWFRALSGFSDRIIGAFMVSVIFFALGLLFNAVLPDTQSVAGINIIRLMMKANYNYFTMSGTVMLGVATGIHLRKQTPSADLVKMYAAAGLTLFLFGILTSFDNGTANEWLTMVVPHIWAIQVYFGLTLLILAGFMHIRKIHSSPLTRKITRFLSVTGILSLPIYVGHSMVIPVKDLLVGVGLLPSLALAIPMLLFFGAIIYTGKRISLVYGSMES